MQETNETVGYEFSIRYRTIHRDGREGQRLNWRFFPSATAALAFLRKFDTPDSPQITYASVARRPLGDWEQVDTRTLEFLAAREEEGE